MVLRTGECSLIGDAHRGDFGRDAVKCSVCGRTAAINMRHHRFRLCAAHFLEWFPKQVERAIERYDMFRPEDRVLVAVSGGADSVALAISRVSAR